MIPFRSRLPRFIPFFPTLAGDSLFIYIAFPTVKLVVVWHGRDGGEAESPMKPCHIYVFYDGVTIDNLRVQGLKGNLIHKNRALDRG